VQAISKAHAWLINALKVLSGIVVFAIFILIVTDVALNLLEIPAWQGTLGAVEYGMLWFTMLAAPWLARIKGHVFIDAITQMLNPSIQKYTAKIAYLVCICGASLSGYYSTELLIEAYVNQQIDERGIDLMNWWLYAPMPVGFFLVAIEFIRYLIGFDDMYGSRTDVKEGM
jgi:C4-dicarboxylate transporter, DctQ subunit